MTSSNNSRRTSVRLAAALLLGTAMSAVAAVPAAAQVNDASLRGTITAPAEGMPSEITAIEVNTGFRRTSSVTADGVYNFAGLRVGTYRLEVTTPQGTRSTDEFTLTVGQSAVFDFDLGAAAATATETPTAENGGVASSGEDIIVTGGRIQTMQAGEVGITVTQRLIQQLPQNNRNFLAFADLAPGVQFQTDSQGNTSLRGGAQSAGSINVFIDGVSQKDLVLKGGVTGQDSTQGNPFPQLAIGEYRVISSNYKAEFDQVSSVAITAVTKSGTNEFHGEGFFDFSNQDLRDKIPSELSGTKVRTRDLQFGGALGGPIIKDVLHFFASYEGKRRRLPVDITPGLNRAITDLPERYRGFFGPANSEFNEDLYFGKINFAPTSSDMFEFSGKYRVESGFNLGSGSSAAETVSATDNEEIRGLARWEHTADAWNNDLRVSYVDSKWAPTPLVFGNGISLQYQGPLAGNPNVIERGTLLTIGGGGNYQDKGQKGWTVQDDFTYTGLTGHTFKVGVKASWIKLRTLQLNRTNPLYLFNTAFNPNGGTFNDTVPFRVEFGALTGRGDPIVETNNFQFGVYAQDDWDVTDRLTLNLGLRWDFERVPSFLDFAHPQSLVDLVTGVAVGTNGQPLYPNLQNANYDIRDYISTGNERKPFTGAFQPRIGFTYELDDAGRFSVFGGYGRSYDRNSFDFLQQEVSVGSYSTRTFNFLGDPLNACTPSATCVPFDPIYLTQAGRDQLLAGAPVGGGGESRFIRNDLKTPYSDQFSIGVRGRFQALQVETGFSHVASKDGFVFLLGNRRPDGSFFFDNPASTTDAPDSPFTFAPPGFGSIILGDNGAETKTNTGYVKLTKTYTQASPWSLDATYSYTHAKENRNTSDQGAFSLDFPSIDDYPTVFAVGVPRHRFVAAGSVDIPFGITLSSKFQIQSPTYLRSLVQTAVPFERTVIVNEAFGNGDRWGRRQFDFAATKYVPLRFFSEETQVRFRVDIINLFNDRNYTDFNGNALDNVRTSPTDTVYRERIGLGVGGNPPRTVKLTTGFSF